MKKILMMCSILLTAQFSLAALSDEIEKRTQDEEATTIGCSEGRIVGNTYGAYCTNDGDKLKIVKVEVVCQRLLDGRARVKTDDFSIISHNGKWVSVTCPFGEMPDSGHIFFPGT
ncbi:hypothetical protein GKC56_04030 [Neisseriaceae bacterium PsAf]|nr:hypothetical protein [Neisseriaceae bacterium PsAf]MCV2502820.1 hypothetical protein [Neisseriaceae bacterium]